MLKHLFKLMWNKKKQNALLLTEILISFLVIFAVFTLLVKYYQSYRKPMGFEYENLWLVDYSDPKKTENTDSLNMYYDILEKTIKAMPEVENLSFCSGNAPFRGSTWQGSASIGKDTVRGVNMYTANDSHLATLKMKLLAGRWFNKSDASATYLPAVIDENLKEELYGKADAVGKTYRDYEHTYRVVGIVQTVKAKGDYTLMGPGMYKRLDTAGHKWIDKMMIRVVPGTTAAFEAKLYKTLANYLKNSNIEILHMENNRTNINYQNVIPMIITAIVGVFLVINVALGIFGVLWYNINKRRGEIGLRRAVGATGMSVAMQLVLESMVLATFAVIIGVFFAAQFPLLNMFDLAASVYIVAIVLAILFVYVLVFLCSLYPGQQASTIYPAVALHEE